MVLLRARRAVAATAATASTGTPTASSARCASRAVAPVVITSSHTTTWARRPAWRRTARAGLAIDPARLALRSPASSPAWSATPGRVRSSRATAAGRSAAAKGRAARRVMARVGSCPRARTAAGRDGTGTSSNGAVGADADLLGRGEHRGRQQSAERRGQAEQPALLVADDHRPQASRRRGRSANGGASPTGVGVGHATAAAGRQPDPAGRAQHPARLAAPDAGRAEQQVGTGVEQRGHEGHLLDATTTPGSGQPADRRLWRVSRRSRARGPGRWGTARPCGCRQARHASTA